MSEAALAQNQLLKQLLNDITTASRRHARRQRAAPPSPPDLVAELGRCADALDLARQILELAYPETAMVLATRARKARAVAALAMEGV